VAIALAYPPATAQGDAHHMSAIPLETMTFEEIAAARTAGTGCTWLGGRGVTRRVAMKEDRGAVKRDGMIVTLRPAAGAKEVFPYTYLHWTGGGFDVSIVNSGKEVGRGPEHVETMATLTLTKNGRSRSWRGRLSCGS
jgi:hypothetical protein